MVRDLAKIALVVLVTVLGACGGGGGGGGGAEAGAGSAAAGSESPAPAGPGMTLLSSARIQAAGLEDMQPNAVQIELGYTGDMADIVGRPLYLMLDIPDRAYKIAFWNIDQQARKLQVLLQGIPGLPAGRYSGTLKIRACLDSACASQLPNSPLAIPYEIEMKPGLQMQPPSIDVTTPFATPAAPVRVAVQPPFNGTWEVATDLSFFPLRPTVSVDGDSLMISPDPLHRPGTYVYPIRVRGSAPDPGTGVARTIEKTLTVTYTVTPSPAPFYLSPTSATYDFTLGDPAWKRSDFTYVTQTADFVPTAMPKATFLSYPAGAAGHPRLAMWLARALDGSMGYVVDPCAHPPDLPACLPAGSYTATWSFPIANGQGSTSTVSIAVTMNIHP